MRLARPQLIASAALLLAASQAAAQARDGEWVSYRDAYRAMVVFEKYGGAKSLVQNELQVAPKEKGAGTEGLQVTLSGKTTQLVLPLDATGRTNLPLLKSAYDENAALVFNRKAGQFVVRPRVSIVARRDGAYDAGELRSACEQALGYARYADRSLGSKLCAAVRFVFARNADASVHLRRGAGPESVLPVVEGVAFPGDVEGSFATVTWRFADTDRARLVTNTVPLAIVPLFE